MNRLIWIYVLATLGFAVCLWGILLAGASMRAAPLVAGRWTSSGEVEQSTLDIEQSGVFIRIRRDNGVVESYKMTNVSDDEPRRAVLRGKGGTVVALERDPLGQTLTLSPFPTAPMTFVQASAPAPTNSSSTTRPHAAH